MVRKHSTTYNQIQTYSSKNGHGNLSFKSKTIGENKPFNGFGRRWPKTRATFDKSFQETTAAEQARKTQVKG